MDRSEISFSLGSLSFSGSGSEAWLSEQLQVVIEAARELDVSPTVVSHDDAPNNEHGQPFTEPLATYLKKLNADTVQNRKFLATADWLRRREQTQIKTADVTTALKNAQQKRLGNASECLNANVSKGFCEKNGSYFYVTPEGLKDLGVD